MILQASYRIVEIGLYDTRLSLYAPLDILFRNNWSNGGSVLEFFILVDHLTSSFHAFHTICEKSHLIQDSHHFCLFLAPPYYRYGKGGLQLVLVAQLLR